ncbi:cysteinyl-tRNA synthetase [Labrenzia sp. EL_159]|nr:cysteinyl-tRNA synthetase [Labrenzia sp. EL_162]MBG6194113.1 cysteinyl-tRNA synthetase [Labrenzia sp. EL_159]
MSAAETLRSGTSKGLKFTNTLTREKEDFRAIDDENVRLYVCGPTVYDFAHIGNARPVIVFDVLYRLLRHVYGPGHVTYARNITDVDDKINARALRDHPDLPLNDAIAKVTQRTADQFHKDIRALGVLQPDHEPRATQHIDGMVKMIGQLIEKGHAYQAGGEVLFDTASMPDYGGLSKRKLDEQKAGARVAVDRHKKSPGDFVLWKLSSDEEPGWESPWGRGRPGWHIECSVMSEHHLGQVFDIHGGGLDLIFPHHENEIAQSRCAHGTRTMANYWLHNGFLQVEGKKMSKSEGNFFTIQELLETENFGGRKWPGEVLRMAMLMTNYREPIDFSVRKLEEAENLLSKWPKLVETTAAPDADVVKMLADDMNTAGAIQALHALAVEAGKDPSGLATYSATANLMGLAPVEADMSGVDETAVEAAVTRRLEALQTKDWTEADSIRAELASQGILLKDSKDSETGERLTTWELKR